MSIKQLKIIFLEKVVKNAVTIWKVRFHQWNITHGSLSIFCYFLIIQNIEIKKKD